MYLRHLIVAPIALAAWSPAIAQDRSNQAQASSRPAAPRNAGAQGRPGNPQPPTGQLRPFPANTDLSRYVTSLQGAGGDGSPRANLRPVSP
jgi:hypothetical protein